MTPTPVVELNLAVAVAMADGPAVGLAMMDGMAASGELETYPYLHAARADLLRRLGRWTEAEAAYDRALALTTNGPSAPSSSAGSPTSSDGCARSTEPGRDAAAS